MILCINTYTTALSFFKNISLQVLLIFQGHIIKPDDPDETDFLSKNPELIWGILIAVFLLLTIGFLIYRKVKRQNEEDED